MSRIKEYDVIEIKEISGSNVPLQPWPQVFYVSRFLVERSEFEVRPLTFTGFVKGVGKNFVTMNYWRVMRLLVIIGFLDVPEACRMSWACFRWDFWNSERAEELRERRRERRRERSICEVDVPKPAEKKEERK